MERDTLSFVLDQDQRFIQVSILLPAATAMNKYIEKSTNRTRKQYRKKIRTYRTVETRQYSGHNLDREE